MKGWKKHGMPGNIIKKRRSIELISAGIIALFLISMLIIATSNARESHAASNTNDPYAQFCGFFYHVTTSMLSNGPLDKYNECLNLSPQFQSYLQSHSFTYDSMPIGTITSTPTGTTTSTSINVITTETPVCSCSTTITPTPTNTVIPTPTGIVTPTPTTTVIPTPTGTATPTPTTTVTSTPNGTGGAWPDTSLVALEIPADVGKTGNNVPAADVMLVENDLTTYLQAQISSTATQQAGYQDALNNWANDPLLPLALATYTLAPTSGQPLFADATDNNPSFTALSTFLSSDPAEVAKIQMDLATKVKSITYKPAGVDCSFTAPSLTQGFQDCLGADTLVDLLYSEQYASGIDTTTLYNNVISIIDGELTGEVNSYLQAHMSAPNATDAQNAYASIVSIKDPKMQETVVDHLLSSVVMNAQTTSCVSPLAGSLPPTTPCVTPTSASSTAVPVATPCATPTGVSLTPVSVAAPCATPVSGSPTPVPTATLCATPTNVFLTPVPCVTPVSGSQTPVPAATPCATPTSVPQAAGKS